MRFRRAYGLAPSTWRKRPTKFQLGAASGVHFRPPGGLRIPARQRMDGMELLTAMVTHHVWVVEQLVERAGQLTDEQLDAPLPARVEGIDGESLRWVLSRLVGQMGMWCAAMDDTAYDFAVEEHESAAAMRERVAVTGPRVRRARPGGRGPGRLRRDVRRGLLTAADGHDVRRDGGPRAHFRGAPPAARRGQAA